MAALDPERFAALRRDFPGADFDDLLATFVDVTALSVSALQAGADAGDAEACRDAAHKLRGGCLAIGALTLARLAGQLEEQVLRAGLDPDARALAGEAAEAWSALHLELRHYMD